MRHPLKKDSLPSKKNGRTQKSLRRWHRWVGYISLFMVIILSITGLILNRTVLLNLNQIMVNNSIISSLYSLSPHEPRIDFNASQKEAKNKEPQWISWLEGRLYLNGTLIANNTARPIGAIPLNDLIIVAMTDSLSLYLRDGSLVETLMIPSIPSQISAIAPYKTHMIWIETPQGNFTSNTDVTAWEKTSDMVKRSPQSPKSAPENITKKILTDFQGQGISLYRLILDLHSGHILGEWGSYLMDLAAISLIFLGITGLMQRKRSEKNRRNRK